MENQAFNDPNFERFLRKELDDAPAAPDEALWEQIAARQSRFNTTLRWKRFVRLTLLPMAATAVVVWWYAQYTYASMARKAPKARRIEMRAAKTNDAYQAEALAPYRAIVKAAPETNMQAATTPAAPQPPVAARQATKKRPDAAAFSVRPTGTEGRTSLNPASERFYTNKRTNTTQKQPAIAENPTPSVAEIKIPAESPETVSAAPPTDQISGDLEAIAAQIAAPVSRATSAAPVVVRDRAPMDTTANAEKEAADVADQARPRLDEPALLPVPALAFIASAERAFQATMPKYIEASEAAPSKPLPRPSANDNFRLGVYCHRGALRTSFAQNGYSGTIGLALETKISSNWRFYNGIEFGGWSYDVPYGAFSESSRQAVKRVFRFPAETPSNPIVYERDTDVISSETTSFSFPIGLSYIGGPSPARLRYLARAYLRPQLSNNRLNDFIVHTNSALDQSQSLRNGKVFFQPGFIGLHTGIQCQVLRRWGIEVAFALERTLKPVGLENVQYTTYSLRTSVWRGR